MTDPTADDRLCTSEFPGDDTFVGQLCELERGHDGDHEHLAVIAGTRHTRRLVWPATPQPDRPFAAEPTEVLRHAIDLASVHARQAARFNPDQPGAALPAVVGLLKAELQHREGPAAPTDEDFLVAIEEALEKHLLPTPGFTVLERTRDAVVGALAPLVAELRRLAGEAQQDPTAAENEALWDELHRRDTETDQPHRVARQDPTQDGQPCPGFPDTCPNPLPVPPRSPYHGGGTRCGCAVARPGRPETEA